VRRIIVLLGPPGAGKGTQAKFIASKKELVHLSTGDILRDEVTKGTQLGKAAKEYMNKGDLVPDSLIVDMINGRLNQGKGFIFDGFPRTVGQAEALEKIVEVDVVIDISLPREEVIRRLSSRRICRQCGKIYNLVYNPPEVDGVCDECGGELFQRDDDKREVIENRYDVYTKATAPLIDFYKQRELLVGVDGSLPTEEVSAQILAELSD
jgi:adenylate kinase